MAEFSKRSQSQARGQKTSQSKGASVKSQRGTSQSSSMQKVKVSRPKSKG